MLKIYFGNNQNQFLLRKIDLINVNYSAIFNITNIISLFNMHKIGKIILSTSNKALNYLPITNKQKYIVSLAYVKLLSDYGLKDRWNKINNFNIYLGMIPLEDTVDILMKECKPTSVITVLENFELQESSIGKPINKAYWKKNGIRNVTIPSPDFQRMELNTLIKSVWYLEKELINNEIVYIHCKAGVGRSATIVTGYIIKHTGLSVNDALNYVKHYRKIMINDEQIKTLYSYHKMLNNNK
jgi:protein-tyrosine phosphatase